MLRFFKKKKEEKKPTKPFVDMMGNPLIEGDRVISFRYNLGECIIIKGENGYEYESVANKTRVNWTLMIDAVNELQKVEKIDP